MAFVVLSSVGVVFFVFGEIHPDKTPTENVKRIKYDRELLKLINIFSL